MAEKKIAIALGFFDGVHIGHAALLERTRKRAAEIGGTATVLSFDTHPDKLVLGTNVPLINSAADREDIMRRDFHMDSVVFIHFNREVMNMPWQDFVRSIVNQLGARWIVVGHDFTFGRHGEGNPKRLAQYCEENGLGCDIIPAVRRDGQIVSSTYIRELIQSGRIERANELLGHPHLLSDTVRTGYHLGTSLGAPTINMAFPDDVLIPRHGVYATKVIIDGTDEHIAVTNVGVRPTVGDKNKENVETHILDFSGNLYGRRARVEFYKFLRDERKFDCYDDLAAQIKRDADSAREYFTKK